MVNMDGRSLVMLLLAVLALLGVIVFLIIPDQSGLIGLGAGIGPTTTDEIDTIDTDSSGGGGNPNPNPTPTSPVPPVGSSIGPFCGNSLCESTESARTCPRDCLAVCGDRACTHTENSDICPVDCATGCGNRICEFSETSSSCPVDCGYEVPTVVQQSTLSATQNSPSSLSSAQSMLNTLGFNEAASTSASHALQFVSIRRSFVVQTVQVNTTVEYKTKVVLQVTNLTGTPLKNIQILEPVPSFVLSDFSGIESAFPFSVREELNAVVFEVPALFAHQTVEIEYVIDGELSEENAGFFQSPLALSLFETVLDDILRFQCEITADCQDDSQCTANQCIKGTCYSVDLPEGEPCDIGSVCRAGVCSVVSRAIAVPEGIDPVFAAAALLILVASGAIVYTYFKN